MHALMTTRTRQRYDTRRLALAAMLTGLLLAAAPGTPALAQAASGTAAAGKDVVDATELTIEVQDERSLDFRILVPSELKWVRTQAEENRFDESGTVRDMRQLFVAESDKPGLPTLAVYAAEIPPERAALEIGYGMLFASVWANRVDSVDRLFDEGGAGIMASREVNGQTKRMMINVWRRGLAIVVVRAEIDDAHAAVWIPRLEEMLQKSMVFVNETLGDALEASMERHEMKLPSGKVMPFLMPPGWKPVKPVKAGFPAVMFQDSTYPEGERAVGLFAVPTSVMQETPPEAVDQAVADTSDLLLRSFKPGLRYQRVRVEDPYTAPGFQDVAELNAFFEERLMPDGEGPERDALGFFAALPGSILGLSTTSVQQAGMRGMGARMHEHFVREQLMTAMHAYGKSQQR